jgi:hypothetical protein
MFEAWLAERLQGSAHHGYGHLIVTEYSLDRFLAGHVGIWQILLQKSQNAVRG